MLAAVFFALSTVIFLPPLAATAEFDFVHLWHELNSRVDFLTSNQLGLIGLPKIYPIRVAGLAIERDRHIAYQIFGITPDCYIYTFWATEAPVFLDKYREQPENTTKWKNPANLKCQDKIIARVQTDRASIPMTLLLVIDPFGRRVRIQSAMNSHYTEENKILWSKLHPDNQIEWYFTQELDRGYTIKKIISNGGNVLVIAADSYHIRVFRLHIHKNYGESTRIRPYLVRDTQLEIDPRIVPPTFSNVMMLRSLFINYDDRPYCPLEYFSDKDLPSTIQDICNAAYSQFIEWNKATTAGKCEPNCAPKNLIEWLDYYEHGSSLARLNTSANSKYTGLIFDWDGQDTGISVPILSLTAHSMTGIDPGIKEIGYEIIGWNTMFRLKRGLDSIAYFVVPLPRRKTIQVNCTDIIDMPGILSLLGQFENATIDQRQVLLEELRQKMSEEKIKQQEECGYGKLLHRISSKKLINGGYLHTRMAPPLVRYEGSKTRFREEGYQSKLLGYLVAVFIGLSTLVAVGHGYSPVKKLIQKIRKKRKMKKEEEKRKEEEKKKEESDAAAAAQSKIVDVNKK